MLSWRQWAYCGVTLVSYSLAGCDGGGEEFKTAQQIKQDKPVTEGAADKHDHDHDHDHDEGHAHPPPHGGTLTMLGDHVAQFELVLDQATGDLSLFVLDGDAEKTLMVEDETLELTATLPGAEAGASDIVPLTLARVKAGQLDSGYTVQSDALKGKTEFSAVLALVKTSGGTHEKVKLNLAAAKPAQDATKAPVEAKAKPDEDHDHDHDHDDPEHKDEQKPVTTPATEK